MNAALGSSLHLRVWPHSYAVARLRALPGDALRILPEGPPVALVAGNGEVSLLAPLEAVEALGDVVERFDGGWRAITLDAVFPLGTVGVMAAIARTLADVGVPIMVFASHDTDHLLVPEAMLGRSLAALHQVRLDRFHSGR